MGFFRVCCCKCRFDREIEFNWLPPEGGRMPLSPKATKEWQVVCGVCSLL